MLMNRTNNVQKIANLKPLLRTKTVECIAALLPNRQPIRFSSSNDGDRVNDHDQSSASTAAASSSSTTKANQNAKHKSAKREKTNRSVNSKSQFISPVSLFGPEDARLPLPGNVGFASADYLWKPFERQMFKLISERPRDSIESNLNDYESNEDRQNRVLERVASITKEELSLENNQQKFKSLFFVKVHKSTQFLLDDMKQIFPKEHLFERDFVIITVYKNPFSKLVDVCIKDEFVNLANSIAESLSRVGCWTNFLVPDSKRSYADLVTCLDLESEERFVNYGVEVEVHADCKLINHINNAKLFIGSVFTSAKVDSVELSNVLRLLTPL